MLLEPSMLGDTRLLAALPVAVCTTDAEGYLAFCNDAAVDLWGQRPEIGASRWCGAWRLLHLDGRPLAHEDSAVAVALREGRPPQGFEAVVERPDGTRLVVAMHPKLLEDETGQVVGAINTLIDISEAASVSVDSERLAAIVSSSNDAIVSKTLDGRITSWNAGATRIFGYLPEEMVGQPITRIIPSELRSEEEDILARLRRGERVEHFDTVRIAKDGRRIDVSLTISPLRNRSGTIVGASKVARDITERKRSDELQRLLFDELNHRVKNTLATIQAIAGQSLRRSATPEDFVRSFNGRLRALARAHDLLVQSKMKGAGVAELVHEQGVLDVGDSPRISVSGPHVMLPARTAVQLALVLHELTTNARKYGALSVPEGRLTINWDVDAETSRELVLQWKESGVPNISAPVSHGFGMTLIERSLEANGGEALIRYGADGLSCRIRLPVPESDPLAGDHIRIAAASDEGGFLIHPAPDLRGKRILLVEDEPLVAMEVEAQLTSVGCEVVGPAPTIEKAKCLIADSICDAALVDANLGGQRVDEVAAALTRRAIPFAFATGYGREALPPLFRHVPLLLKPFNGDQLFEAVAALVAHAGDGRQPATPSRSAEV